MTDEKTRCESASHEQHLCWIATQIVRSQDRASRPSVEEVEALSRNAQFRCEWCGRVAAKERNLCKPVELSENEQCASATHDQHLCHIVAQAVLHNEPLSYHRGWPIPQGREALIRDPRWQCRTCGRTAKNKRNVCDPTEISPA